MTATNKMKRDKLCAAVNQNDHAAIESLGWDKVFRYVERSGAKEYTREDRGMLAWTLGDQDPSIVLEAAVQAVRDQKGGFRPTVSQIAAKVAIDPKAERTNQAPRLRPDQRPEAHKAVREAIAEGRPVCDCSPSPTTLARKPEGVLICLTCRGIDRGQANDATEEAA